MENYIEYIAMGKVSKVCLKPGCAPSNFECQEDGRKRPCNSTEQSDTLKEKRMMVMAEGLIKPEESCTPSSSFKDTSDKSSNGANVPEIFCEVKSRDETLLPLKPSLISVATSSSKAETILKSSPTVSDLRKINGNILIEEKHSEIIIKKEKFDESNSIEHITIKEENNIMEDHEPIKKEIQEENVTTKHERIDLNEEFSQDKNKTVEVENQLNTEIIIKEEIFDETVFDHQSIQNEDKNISCDVSDKNFQNSLVVHKWTHTGEKPFSCEICDKAFTSKNNLIVHERIHSGEKPFFCEFCDKSFSQRSNFDYHKRTHTGEKPFSCNICDKSFTQKTILDSHTRTHTGEKHFVCEICDKVFTYKPNLLRHERIHSGRKPFSCDVCDKTFTIRDNLITHKRMHTREKPFSCDVCDKSFTTRSSVITHKRIHSGRKPYSCEVCDKSFTQKISLDNHKRTHTQEKPFSLTDSY
ncbi:zinc finger protein OZF-like [Chrysoperla carnea]|uniref:zinc finger protein OZF-like n=1 Tax=Chrysoperla carnea TaxID=189513 RepID=UPI001D0995D3|nr:zinc finger protein OZF-like [Chrysoperla carnea]